MKKLLAPAGFFLFTLGMGLTSGVAQTNAAPAPPLITAALAPAPPNLAAPQGKVAAPGKIDISTEPIVRVVANVEPAVVNITAEGTAAGYTTNYDAFFRQYRGMREQPEQSIGSGLLVSQDGFIVTNAHVVALAEKEKLVNVTLSTGSQYKAQIVAADEDADLALLQIVDRSSQFPYFDLSYVSPNLLGETVVALGSPAGYQNSVSHGILSASKRTFTVESHKYTNLLQTDAAINPGNSGGPLVDLNGGLVGLNSAKLSGEAIENIGFAIPQEVVVPWTTDAMAVARGLKPAPVTVATSTLDAMHKHLGLQLEGLTADKAAELNLELPGGLLITRVDEGSPAAEAGLREGMVVVRIGNRETPDENSLPKELLRLQSGVNVRLHLILRQTMGMLVIQRGGSVVLTAR